MTLARLLLTRQSTVLYRLVQPTILLLLTATTMAQAGRDPGPTLQQRARQLEPFIVDSARRYGIDPSVLRAVCFTESRFRTDAISPKGARGPMQFMPDTARRYGLQNPHDAKAAIDAGARYLRDLLTRFNGRLNLALAAYNAGEGTVESFQRGRPVRLTNGKVINPRGLITGGLPPYIETRNYVSSIISQLVQPSGLNSTAMRNDLRSSTNRDLTSYKSTKTDPAQSRSKSAASSFIDVP